MAKNKLNILVVFYSMTGNVAKLAKASCGRRKKRQGY